MAYALELAVDIPPRLGLYGPVRWWCRYRWCCIGMAVISRFQVWTSRSGCCCC